MVLSRMAKKTLQQRIDPYLTPQNILLSIFGIISIFVILFFLVRGDDTAQSDLSEDQIRMEKNGEVVTIEELRALQN